MIKMRNICKTFRAGDMETLALNNTTFEVQKSEFIAVMGPSGCGKSTLLNVLGLIDSPTSGDYIFDGQEVSKYREGQLVDLRKDNIGFIFQNFNLIDELSIFENVELPLLYQRVPKKERRQRTEEALERVDLTHRMQHRPDQLSGGQQQRVAIARAVVARPKLLLADEPTGNLDTKNGGEVMSMLESLVEEGMTIIIVTHSEEEGNRAQRIIPMLDGKVLTSGAEASSDRIGD